MAKEKRFPSDANKPKAGEKKPVAKPAAGPLPAAVGAPSQKTVTVEYKKENNHILGIGAHALAKGINTLPEIVWKEAKKHPSILKMLELGHLIENPSLEQDAAPVAEQPLGSSDSTPVGSTSESEGETSDVKSEG